MRFDEFADCQAWWNDAGENERGVARADRVTSRPTNFNLDLRNPNRPDDLADRPPAELIVEMMETEEEIIAGSL